MSLIVIFVEMPRRTPTIGRVDRLDLTLRVIRDRPGITARDLAAEFGVSERSVFRDLDHLRARGIPVEASRGRGGGLRVNSRWGVGNVFLSNEESLCLLLSLAIAEQAALPMFSAEVGRARKKIVDAFPQHERRKLGPLRERLLIGQNASAKVRASYGEPSAVAMRNLQLAFVNLKIIVVDYVNEKNQRRLRRLAPHVLLVNWPAWYLLAYDHGRGEARTFRLDRMLNVKVFHNYFTPRPREITESLVGAYGVPLRTV